jgi:hypothetical protein
MVIFKLVTAFMPIPAILSQAGTYRWRMNKHLTESTITLQKKAGEPGQVEPVYRSQLRVDPKIFKLTNLAQTAKPGRESGSLISKHQCHQQ